MTARPDDLSFRPATTDDVDAVVAVVEAAYRGEPTHAAWTTEAHLLGGQRVDATMVTDAVLGPDTEVVVATDPSDGEVVACCEVARPDDRGHSVLGMFAVDPRRQAAGLGRRVLAAGERLAADLGATAVELHVFEVRTELIDWYRRRGYRTTGERVPFPYGDERFGLPRRDDLWFSVLVKAVSAEAQEG